MRSEDRETVCCRGRNEGIGIHGRRVKCSQRSRKGNSKWARTCFEPRQCQKPKPKHFDVVSIAIRISFTVIPVHVVVERQPKHTPAVATLTGSRTWRTRTFPPQGAAARPSAWSSMADSNHSDSEDGELGMFTEPEGYYEPEKQPTFAVHRMQSGQELNMRLVGHNPLWVGLYSYASLSTFYLALMHHCQ